MYFKYEYFHKFNANQYVWEGLYKFSIIMKNNAK